MSKAEDRAFERYPDYKAMDGGYVTQRNKRKVFTEGYHQAEKDLELTWEDLKLLQDISHEVFAEVANGSVDYYQIYPTPQSFLEEVLKRYKKLKGE